MCKQTGDLVETGFRFASSYTDLECCRLPAGRRDDNEGPRRTTAADVFGVGQVAFNETRKVVGYGEGCPCNNEMLRRMTAWDVVAPEEAAFQESREVVARHQLTSSDNKWACRTKRGKSSVHRGVAGATTTCRVVRRPRMLSLIGRI